MKFLRRYNRHRIAAYREWQYIPEHIAMNIIKATVPKHAWNMIPKWLKEGIILGNNVVNVKGVIQPELNLSGRLNDPNWNK
jgi:maltooligosyltrehalose synthase